MPAATVLVLRDVRGRPVPLARVRLADVGPMDGLGGSFFKSKGLKKFWTKYRKPIVGGALAAGAVVGAMYTGGATLTALPSILGKVAKVGGKVVDAAGGTDGILSTAGSFIGGRGGGGGEAPAVVDAAPMSMAARSPAMLASYQRTAPASGLGGIPTPVLIGGVVAVLALLMLMNQRQSTPQIIEVRRP